MIGQTVSHYKILEELGEGGMGVVYKAQDLRLDRLVAVKFLSPHLRTDKGAKKRFMQEAKAASALDHSNIATIHDVDETPDGQLFIVMACYEGETLRQRLDKGPLDIKEAVDIVEKVSSGLAKAHERGIVHRDIKPANIITTSDGEVKILDFGLAKLAGSTRVTRSGFQVGTPSYMSPEQAQGVDVDARTDVWAVGAVLYELLTGQRAFPGDHEAAVVYQILNEDPPPLTHHNSSLPQPLQQIVDRALKKESSDRYRSMKDLVIDLEDFQQGKTARLGASRANPWRRAVVAVAVLAVAAYAAFEFFGPARGPVTVASGEERFIVAIAPFWGSNEDAQDEGRVMQALVERKLNEVIGREKDVQILGRDVTETPRSHAEAKALGTTLNATIVLWGEVLALRGEVEIQPYLTMMRTETGAKDRSADPLEASLTQPNQLGLRKAKAEEVGNMALLLGGSYYTEKDPDRALALFQGISPPTSESVRLQGNVAVDKEDWEEAERLYKEAAALDPADPRPPCNLGFVYFKQERFDEATAAYQQAMERDPEDARWHDLLAWWVYKAKGEYEKAVVELRKAVELDAENAAIHNRLGWVYGLQGKTDDAIVELQRAIELDSTRAWAYNDLGVMYNRQRKTDEANALFHKAIALDSTISWPYANLGSYEFRQGNVEKGVALYQKAMVNDPALGEIHARLAWSYYRRGMFDETVAEARKAIEINPRDDIAYNALGGAYATQEKYEEAIGAFEKVVELQRESFAGHINLGQMYVQAGRLEKAITTLERAIELRPDYAGAYYSLGQCYRMVGEYTKAAAAYKTAAEKDPSDLYNHISYFLNLYRAGEREKAREYVSKLVEGFEEDDLYTTILRFYAGKAPEDAVWDLASAEEPHQDKELKCEAYFYTGMAHFLGVTTGLEPTAADTTKAIDYFEKCLATEISVFTEYVLADLELTRLGKR